MIGTKKKMKNKWVSAGCVCAALIGICSLLTGCSVDTVPVSDTQISYDGQAASDTSDNNSDNSSADSTLLSEDVCIVPQKSNTATDAAITADAALLIDDSRHKVLYAQNVYGTEYPASVSKIATALMAIKYANPDDTVTISNNASHITEYGARLCGFQEGDKISMKDLLYCMLIYSGNDASVAIAEHISGSEAEFASKMNKELVALGASGTHFVNSHGLHDDNHYTTAYDLYLIFHELLKYDDFREIIQCTKYTATWENAQGKKQSLEIVSSDPYLTGSKQPPKGLTAIGGKSGVTVKAGGCLIMYFQDKKKRDYISIILKADSSYGAYTQMNHLLEYVKRGK
ncbi:MAG: D-alanyl-D-alanine carboxypeptidase [Clostridium sp.]|nr:D-alanyl-D-alanine carboxypeptidase [Clostridium sp.]